MNYWDRIVAVSTFAWVVGLAIALAMHNQETPTLASREPDRSQTQSALCDTWAATINAERDSYIMHVRGCDSDPYGGYTWYRNLSRCDSLAYSLALDVWSDGRIASDDEIFTFMSTYQFGCVVYEDGTWSNE